MPASMAALGTLVPPSVHPARPQTRPLVYFAMPVGLMVTTEKLMNDRQDKARFKEVARLFSEELARFGLAPAAIRVMSVTDVDGWYTTAAIWAKHRPKISVWYDRWLDNKSDRHFWFGFFGRKDRMELLRASYPQTKVLSFEGVRGPTLDVLRQFEHVVYEDYQGDEIYLGKYVVGIGANRDLATQAAEFVVNIIQSVEPIEEADVKELRDDKKLDLTTRQALIAARRGQGQFRRDLERIWNGCCSVTSCDVKEVLRASHIKPWKLANNKERLDPHNGLLLSATLDALFDRGLISFDRGGSILISSELSSENRDLLGLHRQVRLSKQPSSRQVRYLEEHQRLFKLEG